jgi:hypothetical protein
MLGGGGLKRARPELSCSAIEGGGAGGGGRGGGRRRGGGEEEEHDFNI